MKPRMLPLALAGFALISLAAACPADAEGACPPGYFQSNQGGQGTVGCAPIPEQSAPVQWVLRWGAVASDDNGHWGMSESRRYRLQAVHEAKRQCRERGGTRCRLVKAYGDACIAIASDGTTAAALVRPTREEAVDAARADCAGYAQGRECELKYSACSKL